MYIVRRQKVPGSLKIMLMGRGEGKSWKKGHIIPLLLDRKDLKLEC